MGERMGRDWEGTIERMCRERMGERVREREVG
jgi:hypothetical protein